MRFKNRRNGFAMLEVMAAIMIFMVIASVLLNAALAMERQAVRRVERNEAYDAALAVVRVMAGELVRGEGAADKMMEGEGAAGEVCYARMESVVRALLADGGMERTETELVVTPEDGSEPFSVPAAVWSEWDGETLVLYGESVVGGQNASVSLTMRRRRATDSDAGNCEWILMSYGSGKEKK